MNEAVTTLQAFALEVKQALIDVAPAALDLALQITRINALQQIVVGLFFAIGAIILVRISVNTHKLINSDDYYQKRRNMEDDTTKVIVTASFGGIFTLVASLLLLNVWNWFGVLSPELKLARDILSKVLSSL